MNQERLQLKGMLAESKKKYRELDMEASGLILIIRTLLNPYVEIGSIDTEKCIVHTKRLHEITQQMKELKVKIKNLEQEFEY